MRTMKAFFTNSIVWAVLVALAYFATDIIDKGQTLNALTPWPVLGYALWLAILLLLWRLFFKPVADFLRLTSARRLRMSEQLEHALKLAAPYEAAESSDPRAALFLRLYAASERELYCTPEGRVELAALLQEAAREFDTHAEERRLIRSYSVAAGIGVVFCRNPMLDGVVLFVMQLRLVIALAKLRGYRPSPVFNLCCLFWVLGNSVVAALTQDAVEALADTGTEMMVEVIADTEALSGAASCVPLLQGVVNLAMQAVLAGTSVYVTGHVFLDQLNREGESLTMRRLISLRREGYKSIGAAVIAGVKKKGLSLVGATVGEQEV